MNSPLIRKISRQNLDEIKYNNCLQNAINYQVYAEIWYLDIVAEKKWDCLIYGDYEVIMPLPFQYFLFIKFITLPPFCQQLGLFYNTTITDSVFNHFITYIKSKRVRGYTFNHHNVNNHPFIGNKCKNHILSIDNPAEVIIQKFARDRKRELKKSEQLKGNIQVSQNINMFFSLIANEYNYVRKNKHYALLRTIITSIQKNNVGFLLEYSIQDIQCNYRLILKNKNKFIILASARKKEKLYNSTSTAIIVHLIKNNSPEIKYLDFEGSDLSGVAAFNESLGAKPEFYTFYKNSFSHDKLLNIYNKFLRLKL
ncbi:hypothetical protein [Rhizosphaericola mali]|uniref:GNAT family N-acetyltransferase n=1 Tax=Rhizosphaericola mali TaxID=2545455 RepID=A0A5P2G9Z3_9BACT|nr:hypothetical protein [Rhizosphaericola mali]QES90762.1 hypothetical protein E0W69_019585 [Rhizosphaericola mali]